MKIKILLFVCLLQPSLASATGLSGDIIFVDGEKWELLGKPIGYDS